MNNFFRSPILLFIICLLILTNCSGQGCVDADDFGDVDSQTIYVYSGALQDTCSYDREASYQDQNSSTLKACLIANSKQITDENNNVIQSNTGCAGFTDEKYKEMCVNQCINECQIRVSSTISVPSWVSTTPKLNDSSIGVDITKESQITITANGTIQLGNNIALPTTYVKFSDLMPNSYGNSSFSNNSILDLNSGQSFFLKFSKTANAGIDSNPISDQNFARRLVAYIIPHPNDYNFNYLLNDELTGSVGVPLMPRFNGWKCLYKDNNLKTSECSFGDRTTDNYSTDSNIIASDLYPNTNSEVSSKSFEVGSDSKKIISYGGFIRWNNDPFKNYNYDPFSITTCDGSGTCSSNYDSSEGLIVGDLTTDFNYVNTDIYNKEVSFKLIGSYCSSITFQELAVFNSNNVKIYFINNFNVSNSAYTSNKIPFLTGYKITLTANNSSSSSGVNCGKFLSMRMLKYNEIIMENSGYVSFRIIDNDSANSNSPSCIINARIINPYGDHHLINDSASQPSVTIYQKDTGSINLPMPNNGLTFDVTGSNFGAIALNDDGTQSNIGTSTCSKNIDTEIKSRYSQCFTNNLATCSLNTNSIDFQSITANCSNGNGENGQESSSIYGGGSGGGGGGNIPGTATQNTNQFFGIGGESGTSYFNQYYHNSTPTISSVSSGNGSGGIGGLNGQNGQINIYNCAQGMSCSPTTYNFNASTQYFNYSVPASGTIRYEIIGGGGGGGGSSCGGSSVTAGANGANGSKVTGVFKNISSTSTANLRIYVGAGGSAGHSSCSSNFSNNVSYQSNLNISVPASNNLSKITFASYGFPVIKTTNLNSSSSTHNFEINNFCHSSASKVIAVDSCIGKNSCSINLVDATFNNLDLSICKNGNGLAGENNILSTSNYGSGGGGGGGNGFGGDSALTSTAGDISGGSIATASSPATPGKSADSYYDQAYHSSSPIYSNANNVSSNGTATINGINFTSSDGYIQTYTVPAGTYSINYSIKGAGGGRGGNYINGSTIKNGGNGASGAQLTGTIAVNPGDVIQIDLGEKGYNGPSSCSSNSIISSFESLTMNLLSTINSSLVYSADYGVPQLTSSNDYQISPSCNRSVISQINSNSSSTSFEVNDQNLGGALNCANGNGSSAISAISPTLLTNAGGAGGAGGGNGSGSSGIISAGNAPASNTVGSAGSSAQSFFNKYFHGQTSPIVSSAGNQANASSDAGSGSVILKQNNSSGALIYNSSSNPSSRYYAYTASTDGTLYYEITGAGGGKGGKNSLSQAINPGFGASGTKLTGTLSVKANDKIQFIIGEKGSNGSNCQNNLSQVINEFSVFNLNPGCTIKSFSFANYGQPNTASTPYNSNATCSYDVSGISSITNCINQTSCTIPSSNFINGSYYDPCPPASGSNLYATAGTYYSDTERNYGGGGGGGGGGSYQTTSGGSANSNQNSGAGQTGPSYYNPTYFSGGSISINSNGGSGGTRGLARYTGQGSAKNGDAGGNGDIKICDSDGTSNCNTYSTPGIHKDFVRSDNKFYYEVKAGGGGGGSPNTSASYPVGGNGANGNKLYGVASSNLTAGDILYLFVGGGGGGGNANTTSRSGGSANSSSLYFLGANGGGAGPIWKGAGGAGGSASFIIYKGNIVLLAGGGGGGGGGGESECCTNKVDGESASANTTLNSSGASFTYNLKKIGLEFSCCSGNDNKGRGGAVSSYDVNFYGSNILSGGDGSTTNDCSSTCTGGSGGGGGGGTLILINNQIAAIAGGGGGGGGNNSSATSAPSATNSNNLVETLYVAPTRKYLFLKLIQPISNPSKSSIDQRLVGGLGGDVDKAGISYCTTSLKGAGGDGGGGTMLSINKRVIAIAGGGGGGAGASLNDSGTANLDASANNNLTTKLKAGPFGKYMAVAGEYRTGTSGFIDSSQISDGSNMTITAPASTNFNDIAFASYGDNSTSPFFFAQTCSIETNLKNLLETNCLFKNNCTSEIARTLESGLSCIASNYRGLAKLSYQGSQQGFSSALTTTGILLGGNGGKNSSKECSGGGGAGGGASAISIISNTNQPNEQEHFLVIAGGGGGGGGSGCDGTSSANANATSKISSSDLSSNLNTKALGKWFYSKITFPRPPMTMVEEDYYEYDDFSLPESSSSDPLKNLIVNSSAFTKLTGSNIVSNKIFIRKGQIIRFSPSSWNGTWTTKNGFTKECGVGMVMQVEPKPALMCIGSRNEKIINSSCIPEFDASATTNSSPLGCQAISDVCKGTLDANGNSIDVCMQDCFRKINCTNPATQENNYQKSGCSISSELLTSGATCSLSSDTNPITKNRTVACNNCNNARLYAAQQAYYLQGNFDSCYDLENYKGKSINIVNNYNNQAKMDQYFSNKNLNYLGSFNGEYGNFENYLKISDHNYQTKTPLNSSLNGRLKFFIVDGSDFNIPSLASFPFNQSYTDNIGYATINSEISLTAKNGQRMEIKLCKESSTTSNDCSISSLNSSSILSNSDNPQPRVVELVSGPRLATNSVNYKFDNNGNLYRVTDPIIGKDCNSSNLNIENLASPTGAISTILSPSAAVTTLKNSKFYCHTDPSDVKKLKLSFKIIDPETNNCNISTGTSSGNLDGIKMKNPKYDSNTASNTNAICTGSEYATANCKKEFMCLDKYSNNSGAYQVKVKVKKNLGASQLLNSILQPAVNWIDGNPLSSDVNERMGAAEKMYKSLIGNIIYQTILKFTLVLSMMFYGFGYLIGVSELSLAQIMIRMFKIGFIYLFVSENGWIWFKKIFVSFFKDGVNELVFLMVSVFNPSTEIIDAINTGNYSNKAAIFSGTDQVITMIFSGAIHKKIWAFLFTGIFGWAYVVIFYYSLANYIFALANAVLLYITAQIMTSILFIIGPLFFIFLLFNQTKDMFDNWIKALVGFGLQQIFLLTTLAFFNMLFIEVLKMSLGYSVCWDDAWVINLGIRLTLTQFWTIVSLPPRTSMSDNIMETGSPDSIPSIFSIIYIWVVASLLKKMVTFMTDIANTISEGIKASEVGKGIAALGGQLKTQVSGMVKSRAMGLSDRVDNALFDSGKQAKSERQSKANQAKKDMANRKELLNAADKAEKKFKSDPENMSRLANMAPEQQKRELDKVRDDAMNKKAEKMGIKDKELNRLKESSGLNYYGTNIFGALLQAGNQGLFKGGALNKPIIDKKDKFKLNRKEAENVIDKMNSKQKANFIERIASGDINVSRNFLEKIKNNPIKTALTVLSVGTGYIGNKIAKATIGNIFNYRALRRQAIRELEAEGQISKLGSSSNRDINENRLIRDRVNQIKQLKKAGKKDVAKNIKKKLDQRSKKRLKKQREKLDNQINNFYQEGNIDEAERLENLSDYIDNIEDTQEGDDNFEENKDILEKFSRLPNFDAKTVDDMKKKDS